jgi:hypothetical protein
LAKLVEKYLELFFLLPSSVCSAVPDEYMKVRNIIFDVIFVGNVSLSEKYVMLDVFTVFIETFCRSMPQEHVFQHLHESSLRLLPTDSCQIDVLLCSRVQTKGRMFTLRTLH